MAKAMLLRAQSLIELLEISELRLAMSKFMVGILQPRGQVRNFCFQVTNALVETIHLRRCRPMIVEEPLLPLVRITLSNVGVGKKWRGNRRAKVGELVLLVLDALLSISKMVLDPA